jgi:nucleotide-binding universal stress UspA family protein
VTADETVHDVRVRNVLVPVDGSEFSLRALPTASALARRLDATVQTISVARDGREAGHLRALASGALELDLADDRVVVVTGTDAAGAIARRQSELESCLVCLTTHGRGRFHGAVIGSVARSVLQQSSKPLVALGPVADNPGWSPRPRSWPEPLSVRRIVACVDGTLASERVVPLAAGWSKALGMSLSILTVVGDDDAEQDAKRYGDHGDAAGYIDHLVERWRVNLPETDGEVLRDPIGVASAIRTHLDAHPAGLLALTTHARAGMERALRGAVAAGIVRASVAPCLVAPAEG